MKTHVIITFIKYFGHNFEYFKLFIALKISPVQTSEILY